MYQSRDPHNALKFLKVHEEDTDGPLVAIFDFSARQVADLFIFKGDCEADECSGEQLAHLVFEGWYLLHIQVYLTNLLQHCPAIKRLRVGAIGRSFIFAQALKTKFPDRVQLTFLAMKILNDAIDEMGKARDAYYKKSQNRLPGAEESFLRGVADGLDHGHVIAMGFRHTMAAALGLEGPDMPREEEAPAVFVDVYVRLNELGVRYMNVRREDDGVWHANIHLDEETIKRLGVDGACLQLFTNEEGETPIDLLKAFVPYLSGEKPIPAMWKGRKLFEAGVQEAIDILEGGSGTGTQERTHVLRAALSCLRPLIDAAQAQE